MAVGLFEWTIDANELDCGLLVLNEVGVMFLLSSWSLLNGLFGIIMFGICGDGADEMAGLWCIDVTGYPLEGKHTIQELL